LKAFASTRLPFPALRTGEEIDIAKIRQNGMGGYIWYDIYIGDGFEKGVMMKV
jgi:hypothetical protein